MEPMWIWRFGGDGWTRMTNVEVGVENIKAPDDTHFVFTLGDRTIVAPLIISHILVPRVFQVARSVIPTQTNHLQQQQS